MQNKLAPSGKIRSAEEKWYLIAKQRFLPISNSLELYLTEERFLRTSQYIAVATRLKVEKTIGFGDYYYFIF